MVLEGLGKSLRNALGRISGATSVDEQLIKDVVKDLQRALLQADVNVQLVLGLTKRIETRALEEKCRACIEARVDDPSQAALVLERALGVHDYEVLPGGVLRIYDCLDAPQRVTQALVEGGVAIRGIESRGANLEDYFLSMIGGVRHA